MIHKETRRDTQYSARGREQGNMWVRIIEPQHEHAFYCRIPHPNAIIKG
jgi:hypothetical protein